MGAEAQLYKRQDNGLDSTLKPTVGLTPTPSLEQQLAVVREELDCEREYTRHLTGTIEQMQTQHDYALAQTTASLGYYKREVDTYQLAAVGGGIASAVLGVTILVVGAMKYLGWNDSSWGDSSTKNYGPVSENYSLPHNPKEVRPSNDTKSAKH